MSLLGAIFGDSSSSTSSATNEQVGAEGTSGPVFGAITTKGGTVSTSTRNTASATTKSTAKTVKGTTSAKGGKKSKNSATTGSTAASVAPDTTSGGAGSGNVNISTTTSDPQAIASITQVSEGSIAAQNELAQGAYNLATTALQSAQNFAVLAATSVPPASSGGQTQNAVAQQIAQPLQGIVESEPAPQTNIEFEQQPTLTAASPQATTRNWTPWIIGGVALVGGGVLVAVLLRKK
jgi:hypothetical protein